MELIPGEVPCAVWTETGQLNGADQLAWVALVQLPELDHAAKACLSEELGPGGWADDPELGAEEGGGR